MRQIIQIVFTVVIRAHLVAGFARHVHADAQCTQLRIGPIVERLPRHVQRMHGFFVDRTGQLGIGGFRTRNRSCRVRLALRSISPGH